MPIVPKFTEADIRRRMDKYFETIIDRLVDRLKLLGEMAVKHARENGSYMDQTGNLRSSIGYGVYYDGVAMHDSFVQIPPKTIENGVRYDGAERAKALADRKAAEYPKALVLVVVAGMNYALAVESGRRKKPDGTYYTATPRDVLTSAEMLVERELPKMLNDLKSNIQKTFR